MAAGTRYARNGEVSIAYETFGDLAIGEPLLLIMGLDFQMVWWPDGFCEQLVEAGFAVVRFDNRDTGLSTHFESPKTQNPFRALLGLTQPVYTGFDMLDDALAVLDAVGWRSAHVMGGSMGSIIGQALALVYPDRVRSLIAHLTSPIGANPFRYLKLGFFPKLMKLKPAANREQEVHNLVTVFRALSSPAYPFPEEWAREIAGISYDRGPRDPRATQRQIAAGKVMSRKLPPLSRITCPTLVIAGMDDPLIRWQGGRDAARQIRGATFVRYPGMGHNLPQELWPDVIERIQATTAKYQQQT